MQQSAILGTSTVRDGATAPRIGGQLRSRDPTQRRGLTRKGEGAAMESAATSSQERQDSGLQRVTVNLTPRTSAALDEAVRLTRDTKTDTINRAVQVYAYLERIIQDGGTVYVRDPGNGELERLHFF